MRHPQSLSIERVVVLLTPVFAAGSTWLATLAANNVPGAPRLDPSAIEGVAIAAFLGAVGVVAKWLHGRQIPAIAQLAPQAFGDLQLAQLQKEISAYVAEHPSQPTPEDVRRVVGEEIRKLLAAGATAPRS